MILNSKLIFSIQKLVFLFKKLLIDPKNGHFYFEYFYMNTKFIFQFWKFCIKILNNHMIRTRNLNFKLLFWILKIITSSLKINNWVEKWTLQFWIFLFEYENWHFNSEIFYLNSKNFYDLKIDIWILNYYFWV